MVKATQSVTCGNCSQLFPPIKIMSSKKKKEIISSSKRRQKVKHAAQPNTKTVLFQVLF